MPSEHNDEWPGGQAKEVLDEFRKNFVLRQVLEAISDIDADYMTSEDHHPGYVLIPTAKFEEIRIASNNYNQRAVQSDKVNFGRECSYAHPVGTRCPVCQDWPYAKGGAAAFNARQVTVSVVQSVSELPDYTSPDDHPDLLQCTADELRDIISDAIATWNQRVSESPTPPEAVMKRIAELEAENFSLAAGVCIYPNGEGLLGDEYGHGFCSVEKARLELDEQVTNLMARDAELTNRIAELEDLTDMTTRNMRLANERVAELEAKVHEQAMEYLALDGQALELMDKVAALTAALEPVMHWYQSDEHDPRPLADILTDVVADLQHDRAEALKVRTLKNALAATHEEKVKEAAEGKLWFTKAQEWRQELNALKAAGQALAETLQCQTGHWDGMPAQVGCDSCKALTAWSTANGD